MFHQYQQNELKLWNTKETTTYGVGNSNPYSRQSYVNSNLHISTLYIQIIHN